MGLEKGAQVELSVLSVLQLCMAAACPSSCIMLQARQVSEFACSWIKRLLVLQIPRNDDCCRVRFNRLYVHNMAQPSTTLTLKQAKFDAEGFASTGIKL